MIPSLTWPALLGHWLDFARASVALPADAEGEAWRRSVAPIINLQAITFALAELDRIDPRDKPLALDRAEILLRRSSDELAQAWCGQTMPAMVQEIVGDAAKALQAAGGS